MRTLYFDTAATTPVEPEALAVMAKVMRQAYGNPSSAHALGDVAAKAVLTARTTLARALGAKAHEIVFTSGTTESNNWVFEGLARAQPDKKKIIISSIEHPSVREVCVSMKRQGYELIEIPVDSKGFIDLLFLEKTIDRHTLVVSVIHAHNIFGTVQDLKKIGDICHKKGVLFHTDAAQSFGKLPIFVHDWHIDLLSASAHKIGGPKGVGLLYIHDGVNIAPLLRGGGQERGLRSGTENVAGIAGFAKAFEIMGKRNWKKISELRDKLIQGLENLSGTVIGARGTQRLDNNIFVQFSGANSESLMYKLSHKGIFVSVGSACDSKKEIEDAALRAIGLTKTEMRQSLRVSLPADVTEKDINYFVKALKNLLT